MNLLYNKIARKVLLPLLLFFIFFVVPFVSVGAVWVQNVGLLPGSAVVFASNTPAIDRFMAAALKPAYGNRIGICDGTADNVEIQAAFSAVSALGIRGIARLTGDFAASAQIDAASNVSVYGPATITTTIAGAGDGIQFTNITSSTWQDLTITRTGNVGALSGIFAGHIEGDSTDNTLVIRHVKFINSCTTTAGGEGLMNGLQLGPLTAPSPILEYVTGQSSSPGNGNLNVGIDVKILFNSATGAIGRPKFYWCIGIGADVGTMGRGWDFTEANGAEVYYSDGIGGTGDGFAVNDCFAFFKGDRGFAGTGNTVYGFNFWGGGGSQAIDCEGISNKQDTVTGAVIIQDRSAASLNNFFGHPPMDGYQWYYDSANNGRFRPFAGHPWYPYSISLWVSVAQPGKTMNIGTSIGGNEIANAIPIDVAGAVTFDVPYNQYVASNAYLYATPSGGIANDTVFIYYTAMYAQNLSIGLHMRTAGAARINNSRFLGCSINSYGPALQIHATSITYQYWKAENSVFEGFSSTAGIATRPVYPEAAASNIPLYNCVIRGVGPYVYSDNITSFAVNSNNINGAYTSPGEVKTASGSLTAGAANAMFFAWHDPNYLDILIKKVVIEVTTGGGTVGSLGQVGIADDAAGTNLGSEFFTALTLNNTGVYDSYLAGDTGAQTKFIVCQDVASATDGWVVGKITAQPAASLVGKYYIEYVGR